jgi:hypothetical protein
MRIGTAALAAPMVALALLTLGGCGRDPEGEGDGNNSSGITVQEPVNETLLDDPQNGVVPLGRPSPAASAPPKSFPASFQGRWGLGPNDCDPSRDDAKGLMVVEPTMLRFYESRATLASAQAARAEKLTARLSFTGEGQSWTSEQRFTLLNGGKALVREEGGAASPLRYARCPVA